MDLGTCPRCGIAWNPQADLCHGCGYVAIGAGLKRVPKKARKRVKWVEPTSGTSLLLSGLAVLVLGGTVAYQPWADDWASARSWFGLPRKRQVAGMWVVVQSVRPPGAEGSEIGPGAQSAALQFSPNGRFTMRLEQGGGPAKVEGRYAAEEQRLEVRDLAVTSGVAGPFAPKLAWRLGWLTDDAFIARAEGGEVLYLRRANAASPLAAIIRPSFPYDDDEAQP